VVQNCEVQIASDLALIDSERVRAVSPTNSRLYLIENQAMVCTADDISRIVAILRRDIAPDVEIRVVLSDGTEKGFGSPQELLEFKNPRTRRIREIVIRARLRKPDYRHMEITITRRFAASQIKAIGETDDKTIVVIRQELGEIIAALKSPFAFASNAKGAVAICSSIVWGTLTALYAVQFRTLSHENNPQSLIGVAVQLALLLAWVVSLLAVFVLVATSVGYLFPPCVFLIGDEIGEDHRRIWIRNSVFVSVLLALLVSIAASFVSSHFL
jgi:hypothetical protein